MTGDTEEYAGVGIIIGKIDDVIIPLYTSYLMKCNPRSIICKTTIQIYNKFRSVRIEALEQFKFTNLEVQSTRILTEIKKVENENLYYIKLNITETTTDKYQQDYVSAVRDINQPEYKSDLLFSLMINHEFSNDETM